MPAVKSIGIGIAGAAGRMGRALVAACAVDDALELAVATERSGHDALGIDAGVLAGLAPLGVLIADRLPTPPDAPPTVLIDFTTPETTRSHLAICRELGINMVIGTTGLTAEDRAAITQASEDIAIVSAPNMSVGVTLCFDLAATAARALGDEVDVEIIEAHHRRKVDAPSGTALHLGQVIADALGRDLTTHAVYGRQGNTGERDGRTIGFESIRAGDIVGEHTVMFAGMGERIEITHRASSREIFAHGALRAARWLNGKARGNYGMRDVLGLKGKGD